MQTAIQSLVLSLAVAGCCALATVSAPAHAANVNSELAALRHATGPFHSLNNAVQAGWTEQITGCLSAPEGGMGYHYANAEVLFDEGVVEATRPELLVYAPDPSGGLRLVAVEYLVFTADLPAGAPIPMLFGQTFHFNPDVDAWVLHAWVWRHNPGGMFADWNPQVSCD